MRQRSVLLTIIAMVIALGADLAACGDKFLRIGRSVRYGRYVAVYPASILIYGPKDSAPARIKDFARALKLAGHRPVVVTGPQELSAALADGNYDLVLAGLDAAAVVARQARAARSHPDVVPVLVAPTAAERAAADTVSSCQVRVPSGHRNDALAEIDHKMELRLGGKSAEPAGQR